MARIRQLELCDPSVFGDVRVTPYQDAKSVRRWEDDDDSEDEDEEDTATTSTATFESAFCEFDLSDAKFYERRRCSILVDQLLLDIYAHFQLDAIATTTDYNSATSTRRRCVWAQRGDLMLKDVSELQSLCRQLDHAIVRAGGALVRRLKRRDALRRQRDARCDVITVVLRKREDNGGLPEFSPEMRFSLEPLPGDSGFTQWHSAMKMVAQLPEGIPVEFRRQLWLSLADKHLHAAGIEWARVERDCFSEWSHPSDAELGVQIVKDLHRTGCSLFCGKDGKENQALLKRVLLAYARWNKAVGYCQGFNMLAALILQVCEKSEADALKLMIYLIEGVLPDSYFADSLRGLSVDMAVFRELLRTKLPKLSRHLDTLQVASKEGTTSYEPPLTNVFTMQWFLTLFCNCLPQPTVLRVWDLIMLEGNEILLRTSLAIWQVLAERIMTAKSADEFYCVMGMLMREILEYDLIDANTLVKGIVRVGPLPELGALREHYLYNINPWGATTAPAAVKPHRDKLMLDIGVLKKQYTKLKQRQRQAHIIFNTAVARQTARPAPVAVNHLLLGRTALVPTKRVGPPKGAVPPPRQPAAAKQRVIVTEQELKTPPTVEPQSPKTLHWRDTRRKSSSSSSSSTSSSDTELCDEPDVDATVAELEIDAGAEPIEIVAEPHPEPAPPPDVTNLEQTIVNIEVKSTASEDALGEVILSPGDTTNLSVMTIVPDLLDFVAPCEKPCDSVFTLDSLESLPTTLSDNNADAFSIFDGKTHADDDYMLTLKENLKRSDSLPSEDGFDFEKFLEERVKCLKEKPYSSEESLEDTSEQDRIKCSRRNSVRALEIIQENSLILHRILQCQSRMTPTPPPCEGDPQDELNLREGVGDGQEETSCWEDVTPTNPPESNSEVVDEVVEGATPVEEIALDMDEEDESSAYLNEFISKYNYISRQHTLDTEPENTKPHSDSDFLRSNALNTVYSSPELIGYVQEQEQSDDLISQSPKVEFHIGAISPTTPLTTSAIDDEVVDYNLAKYRLKLGAQTITEPTTTATTNNLIEIDANSKYNSIIAYSRNLDERFNTLIMKSPRLTRSNYSVDVPDRHLIATRTTSVDAGYAPSHGESGGLQGNDTIQEEPRSHSYSDFSLLQLRTPPTTTNLITTTEVQHTGDCSGSGGGDDGGVDALIESPNLKSPNRIYNPFPVSIASRQNKEVPFRLGLYKK